MIHIHFVVSVNELNDIKKSNGLNYFTDWNLVNELSDINYSNGFNDFTEWNW